MSDQSKALSRLLISTINAREVESARVSRALHDEVGQVLSAVGLQLDVLKLDFKAAAPEIVQRVEEIQRMLDRAVQEVRSLSYDLNPAVVERAGLQFALDRLVGRYRQGFSGSLRFLFDPGVRVPLQIGDAWYKIAEHAVANSVEHGACTKIEVLVKAQAKAASLEVRDNGKGFPVASTKRNAAGIGLLLMDHYAAAAGIDLSIRSTPARGTTVRASWAGFPGAPEPPK